MKPLSNRFLIGIGLLLVLIIGVAIPLGISALPKTWAKQSQQNMTSGMSTMNNMLDTMDMMHNMMMSMMRMMVDSGAMNGSSMTGSMASH